MSPERLSYNDIAIGDIRHAVIAGQEINLGLLSWWLSDNARIEDSL